MLFPYFHSHTIFIWEFLQIDGTIFSLTFDPKQENQHTEQSKIICHVSVYMKSRLRTFKEESNKNRSISKLKNMILEKPQEVLRAVLISTKLNSKIK